jgi:hypothetical protein
VEFDRPMAHGAGLPTAPDVLVTGASHHAPVRRHCLDPSRI